MAEITPKVWTVADVALGLLEISVLREAQEEILGEEGEVIQPARPMMLQFKRSYRLVDGDGRMVPVLATREVKVRVSADAIPAQILSALQQINAWTRERALEHAGLVEVEQPEEPI
jgi:hypothetical protein